MGIGSIPQMLLTGALSWYKDFAHIIQGVTVGTGLVYIQKISDLVIKFKGQRTRVIGYLLYVAFEGDIWPKNIICLICKMQVMNYDDF